MLTLYLFWRALVEVRWRWFAAAGVTWTLAILTRSEAWLFLICGGLWLAWRWLSLEQGRWRLLAGTALGACVPPLLLLAVNLTWLRDHSEWEWGRFRHLQFYQEASLTSPQTSGRIAADVGLFPRPSLAGLASMIGHGGLLATVAAPVATHAVPPLVAASDDSTGPSRSVLLRKFGLRLYKAYDPAFGLLFLVGACCGWRALLRRQQLAIVAMNVCLVVGVWRFMCHYQEINLRYFFVAVITSTPCAALGFAHLVRMAGRVWSRPTSQQYARRAVTGGLATLVLVGCLARIALPRLHARRDQLDLGRWALGEFGPHQTFVGTYPAGLFEYYAQGKQTTAGQPPSARALLKQVKRRQPAMVVVWDPLPFIDAEFESDMRSRGYHPLPVTRLPPSCEGIQVFVRDAADRLATPSESPTPSPPSRR
jgi:hypothetical protein